MTDSLTFIIPAVVAALLLSMTLHEAMHAYVAYWLGDDTAKYEGRLSLNPIRHIDPFLTLLLPLSFILLNASNITSRSLPVFGAAKPVPFNPNRVRWEEFGAALVGLAGPLTNLLLAAIAAGFLRVFGAGGSMLTEFLLIFVQVNVGFFVFNMIPFPPLDGSRPFYALAPEPIREVMRSIEGFGLTGIFVFMFLLFPLIRPILVEANGSILRFLLV